MLSSKIWSGVGSSNDVQSVARKETLDVHQKNVLGYYRKLGSLRYGTSTASCKDAYGKMPFFS